MRIALLTLAVTGSLAPAALPQDAAPGRREKEPVITVDGVDFFSWPEYVSSPYFRETGRRCGTLERHLMPLTGAPEMATDCDLNSTNPTTDYDPVFVYDIPVVVHVIQSSGGTGFISTSLVQSQIDILNEDFLALPGTNGALGNNVLIQFHLATVDPQGNPTNGITYSTNTTWFNDSGSYWNSLAWDTDRYLNIYTNSASGFLGYVPALPQAGIVGDPSDRVVILWSAFGRNAPIGPPYNQGRTATHEVGHYFGLDHTFSGGCAPVGSCYSNGDLICDTNPEQQPRFGCPGNPISCGNSDPVDNYMDYTDDLCMERFTIEQNRRMRCTIAFWRPDLIRGLATSRNGGGGNPVGFVSLNLPLLGANWNSTVDIVTPGATSSFVFVSLFGPTSGGVGGIGELLVLPPFLLFPGTGSHALPIPGDPAFLGVPLSTQGATSGPGGFQLNNAIDLVFGN